MKELFNDKILKNRFRICYIVIMSIALSFLVFFILFNSETRFFSINYIHTHNPSVYLISEENETQSIKCIDNRDIKLNGSVFQNHTLEPIYISNSLNYDMITGDYIQASFQIDNKIKNTTAPLISYNQLSQFDIIHSFNNDQGVYLTTDLMEEMGIEYDTIDDDTVIDLVIPMPVYNGYDKSQQDSNPVALSIPLTIQSKVRGIVESDYDLENVFHTSSYVLFPYELIDDENQTELTPSDTVKQNYELSRIFAPAYLIKCDEEEVLDLYNSINNTLTKEQTDLIVLSPYLNIQNQISQNSDFQVKLFISSMICSFALSAMLIYKAIKRRFFKQPDFNEREYIKSLDKIQLKQYLEKKKKTVFRMQRNIFTVVYILTFIIFEFVYPKGETNILLLVCGYVFMVIVIKLMFFLRIKLKFMHLVMFNKYIGK